MTPEQLLDLRNARANYMHELILWNPMEPQPERLLVAKKRLADALAAVT